MSNFVVVYCLCVGATLASTARPFSCHNTWQPDYYWRDYHGVVPDDAVEGGYDLSGNVTYIGQITIENKVVLPGVINPGTKLMYVPYFGRESGDNYVKILCSQHLEKFAWVPTKIDDLHLLTDYYLVVGGFEPPHTAYIGRVSYENVITVGKVFTPQSGSKGLRILNPKKAETEVKFESFEILGYVRG